MENKKNKHAQNPQTEYATNALYVMKMKMKFKNAKVLMIKSALTFTFWDMFHQV